MRGRSGRSTFRPIFRWPSTKSCLTSCPIYNAKSRARWAWPQPRRPSTYTFFRRRISTALTRSVTFPQVPYRSALFVIESGKPGVYTYDKGDLDIDLRHECTHALLHASLPVVPLWLDEGIAKYFEVPADQRAFDHPYFEDLKWKWSLRLGMVRSIESLEQRDNLSDMDATDYRYAWAWVHFMMHGPEAAHQVLVHNIACYQQSIRPGSCLSSWQTRCRIRPKK